MVSDGLSQLSFLRVCNMPTTTGVKHHFFDLSSFMQPLRMGSCFLRVFVFHGPYTLGKVLCSPPTAGNTGHPKYHYLEYLMIGLFIKNTLHASALNGGISGIYFYLNIETVLKRNIYFATSSIQTQHAPYSCRSKNSHSRNSLHQREILSILRTKKRGPRTGKKTQKKRKHKD